MTKVQVVRSTISKVVLKLEQYEDRRAMDGPEEPDIVVREASEPECYELRSETGRVVLNKGELRELGLALLELSDYHENPGHTASPNAYTDGATIVLHRVRYR